MNEDNATAEELLDLYEGWARIHHAAIVAAGACGWIIREPHKLPVLFTPSGPHERAVKSITLSMAAYIQEGPAVVATVFMGVVYLEAPPMKPNSPIIVIEVETMGRILVGLYSLDPDVDLREPAQGILAAVSETFPRLLFVETYGSRDEEE